MYSVSGYIRYWGTRVFAETTWLITCRSASAQQAMCTNDAVLMLTSNFHPYKVQINIRLLHNRDRLVIDEV